MSKFYSDVNRNYPNTFPPNACWNESPVLFTSGKMQGAGYIVIIEKTIKFMPQASSALAWSGPTLLLKFDSVFETSTFAVIDADIVFEQAKVKTCEPVTISSSRGVFVKSLSLDAHELTYPSDFFYQSWQFGSSWQTIQNVAAFLTRDLDVTCRAPLTFQSK